MTVVFAALYEPAPLETHDPLVGAVELVLVNVKPEGSVITKLPIARSPALANVKVAGVKLVPALKG